MKTLAAAARLLLDLHFTPVLADLICAAVDLDVAALDVAGSGGAAQAAPLRPRRRSFAEEVLRAYAYQCAMCGFDGALGRYPVGIQAAHVRWHSQEGPDEIANALALCALHHALFDLGALGITEDRRIRVSSLYVARNEAGLAVDALADQPLLVPRPHQPSVDVIHISWHHRQVFKGAMRDLTGNGFPSGDAALARVMNCDCGEETSWLQMPSGATEISLSTKSSGEALRSISSARSRLAGQYAMQ